MPAPASSSGNTTLTHETFIILIFKMLLEGRIKLSRIFEHNFDKGTDRLYEPLRVAVESTPSAPSTSAELEAGRAKSIAAMKCSQINISRAEQDLIKNSTFIPINQKLVRTDNPEKQMRARSRSYKTLSVEQRIGSPMGDAQFRQSVARAGQQVEIVYDYDSGSHPKAAGMNKLADYYGAVTASTMSRTRSATYVGAGTLAGVTIRPERAETRMVKVERRPSNHSSTSIQVKEGHAACNKARPYEPAGEYYENCKKYAFKTEMKERPKRLDQSDDSLEKELIRSRMPTQQSDYKYNLFNLLDDPINTKCSNGLCHKNEIVATRVKKRW